MRTEEPNLDRPQSIPTSELRWEVLQAALQGRMLRWAELYAEWRIRIEMNERKRNKPWQAQSRSNSSAS